MRSILRSPAPLLWVLLTLFIFRVLGQIIVLFFAPSFLPSMEEWFSGLVPYPYLLTSQILIIALMIKMTRDVQARRNFWGTPEHWLGEALVSFGIVYLSVMIIRYSIRMTLYPLERWTGGSIPIVFHWVLASFVLIIGMFHLRNSSKAKLSQAGIASRIGAWLVVVVGVVTWTTFQLAPTALAKILHARDAQYAVRIERSVSFTTTDGTTLAADVFHPQRAQKAPIILVRIPYSKVFMNSLFGNVVGRFWAERGYTVVLQGTRGRYESSGKYEPLIHEESDGKETLAWMKQQPWFSDKIGMWGGSYFGYTQYVLADTNDPEISAFIVQLASADFSKMFYTDGAFALESALQWALGSYGRVDSYPTNEKLETAANTIPLLLADEKAEGVQIGFLRDWMKESTGSPYWEKLNATPKLPQIKGPVLFMAGWFDPFLSAQIDDYQMVSTIAQPDVAEKSKLIIGPWAHARSVTLPDGFVPRHYRLESLQPSLDWFDEHLLESKPEKDSPRVRIFVMGQNRWRDENEWPLRHTVYTSYFLEKLGSNRIGALSSRTNEPLGSDSYVYDPMHPLPSLGGAMIGPNAGTFRQQDTSKRSDVLTYETGILSNSLEVTGHPKLVLSVGTTAPNTDFSARLMDVFPNGSIFNMTEGIIRRGFGKDRTDIEIQLWPTSYVFKEGHKIRLEISSSNFPRFNRNFNAEMQNSLATASSKANQTIFYGKSKLILPIIQNK